MEMLLRFTASIVLALIMGTACDGQHYARINLVSTAGRTTERRWERAMGITRFSATPFGIARGFPKPS
jgi:hypothetical protein